MVLAEGLHSAVADAAAAAVMVIAAPMEVGRAHPYFGLLSPNAPL